MFIAGLFSDRQAEANQRYNGGWNNDENAFNSDIDDDQYMDERKRSMFRERGGKSQKKRPYDLLIISLTN